MKKLLLGVFAMGLTFALFAQEPTFQKGDKVLNLGLGLGSTLYSGTGYTSSVPPVSASFEIGIKDDVLEVGSIGLGGYIGYAAWEWKTEWFGDTWGYKYTDFILGVRGTFHYPLLDKLDTYTGLMIGYESVSAKEFGTVNPLFSYNVSTGGGIWSWYAGGRYYFTDKFAGMLEVGYGIAYLNLGVALKL